jgi:pantothenate kinase
VRAPGRLPAAAVRARGRGAGLTSPPLDELVDRARSLARAGRRRILGIAGAPGSGKSTLAAALAAALGPDTARLVGMDGFHLAQAELERLGRADRKGAPDTFDAAGYTALLRRLRESEDAVVYAPEFRRAVEEPIACAVPVPREVPLVVTEGNYLLVGEADWRPVRDLLDETWFVEGDDDRRRELLIARHIAFGKPPGYAREWVLRSDERNAELVATTRGRADLIVRVD